MMKQILSVAVIVFLFSYPGNSEPVREESNVKVIRSGSFFYDTSAKTAFPCVTVLEIHAKHRFSIPVSGVPVMPEKNNTFIFVQSI